MAELQSFEFVGRLVIFFLEASKRKLIDSLIHLGSVCFVGDFRYGILPW